ncbi:MAG: Eco57I restriction-modification methylase domain-containing protein, partial [Paludibacteraceae bacterium]
MDNQFLKSYFASDYKGIDSIINEILIPIFGAQNFEEGYDLLTRPDSAFTKKAHTHHIQSVAYHGTIYAEGIELKVYDVTLDSRANIARSRVGIRQVVAEMVEQFDGAFIIFHYVDNTHRSWRLSYIEKIPGQKKSKRFTYLCGENFSCRTIAERLNELQKSPKNAKALETAFSVEALSNEFFSDYKHQYEIFCQYIEDNKQDNTRFGEEFATEEGKYIRDYVKKLMGRLTFLCFLQRRGWMGVPVSEKDWYGGDTQFIYNLFQKATPEQKDNFLDEVLEPLFFECLNEKREGDIYDTRVAAMGRVKIPYLNGGLFDREPIDNFRSVFPAKLFQDLFNFFASYNFTIDENDPNDAEVGVDPEMLGKIFENLLEDNKEKGAFYTPKEIVQYMCQEALINYLETETSLSKETIRLFAKSPEDSVKNIPEIEQDKLRKSLESVKICDPAIGSGAFPMELLNELLHCREALMDDPYNRADIKKSIIQNNIYGVDIEQGAIDIARLRFWLSIVVDEDTPSPLPNLDYKIMHGNSLLTTFNGKYLNINDNQKHANIQAIIAKKKSLQQKQKEYFLLNGQAKYEKEIDIKNLILDIIDLQLGYERNSFAIKQIQTGTLFGEDTPKQMSLAEIAKQKAPEKQATIDYCKVLRETLNDTTKSIEERARTKIPFFDWQIMFADVFNRSSNCNGFDIVIGNPPYIQLQNNGGELATMYAPCEFDTFARTGDIYCLFYEKGNKLLHDGGHLCYITSNKWMRAGYGEKTREFFANKTNPKLLIDFAGVKIFESATVDTNILLFQKAKNTHSTTCCVTKKLDKEGVKNLSDFVLQNSTQCAFTSSD